MPENRDGDLPPNHGVNARFSLSARFALSVDVVIAACTVLALFIVWTGGGRTEFAGLVISTTNWVRPAVVALALFLIFRVPFLSSERSRVAGVIARGSILGVASVAVAAVLVTATGVIHACGGLDSHGYVGASALFSDFQLKRTLPDLSWLPIDRPADVAAPLGFIASRDGHAAVPEFPPGLPLIMAVVRSVFDPEAVFWVSWVSGLVTSVLVFLLARRIYGNLTGQLAAILVIAHPVFAAYSMQPMSDVPAGLWIVLSVYFTVGRERPRPVWAGLAGTLAFLTRPPLGLALLVLAGSLWRTRPRHALVFVGVLLPGVIGLLLLQQHLYGSPWMSGHGDASHLFTLNALRHNLFAQGKWFLVIHTPLVLPLVWLGYRSNRHVGGLILALFAAVSAPYLFYVVPFDDWEMLRFLLPGLILLMVVAAGGLARLLREIRSPIWQHALALALSVVLLISSGRFVDAKGIFGLSRQESKYPLVAAWFDQHAPKDAIVLAALHSGSIYYYSGRLTIRWDRLPSNQLPATLAAMESRGRSGYLVLDGSDEAREFNKRFGADPKVRIYPAGRVRNVSIAEIRPK